MRTRDTDYWEEVRRLAADLESDGCSCVPEFYHDCCLEHDIAYRTHRRVDGSPITKDEADKEFRECIQSRSLFRRFSLMSWWRWCGVKYFGKSSWEKGKSE